MRCTRRANDSSNFKASRNAHRTAALEELAKFYEHREKNPALALEFTLLALKHEETPALHHRRQRLEKKMAAGRQTRRLL